MKRRYRLEWIRGIFGGFERKSCVSFADLAAAVDQAEWIRSGLRRPARVIDVRTGEVIYPKDPNHGD